MAAKTPIALVSGELENFQSGDFVPIANGGTGGTTITGAQTALNLLPGTNVQAWDADLDAIAALASTGIAVRTTSNTWAQRQVVQPSAGITVTNPAGVAGDITLALANDLGAIEALNTNGMLARTGTDTWAARTLTGTANQISLTNGDGIGGNPTIGFTTNVTFPGTVTLNADPASALQAVTKQYADAISAGQRVKASVRVLASANTTVSNPGTAVFDGVTLSNGDRILLVGQTTGSENGAYTFNGSGSALTRATDYDTSAEVHGGDTFWVNEGTTNADTGWTLTTNDPITLGSTSLTFTQSSGLGQVVAGAGLTKTGDTIDIVTAASTRIVINADSIDLGQPTIGGSGATSGVTKVTVDVYGRVTNTGTATASDVGAQPADNDLTAIAAFSSTGIAVRTATDTWAQRTLQQPAAGLTITNPAGVAGDPTFALANDLSAIEALNTNGMLARTATDTWAARTITGASSNARVTVTNGDGISGNPTIDLTSGVNASPGSYTNANITVDTYGRVTFASNGSGGSSDGATTALTNNQGSTINIGQCVYSNTSGTCKLAQANSSTTKDFTGFVSSTTIANGASGNIVVEGIVTATTTQWDAVTGGSGGLTTNSRYYLDGSTAGKITTTPPSTAGTTWAVEVGVAISTTKLEIKRSRSVKN